jgi:hypothetical protein
MPKKYQPEKYRVSDAVPSELVIIPESPKREVKDVVPLTEQDRSGKHPVDPREYPAARDSRGKASRDEIRQETARHVPSRQSAKAPERSHQPRSGKPNRKDRPAS